MDNITAVDLSQYRLTKAKETLETAKRDLEAKDYASANNRAYYAIFHGIRAVLALDGEDYKKHSAVIARFTQLYLKSEIFPKEYGKTISHASLIRNRSDYEDFFICSNSDTEKLVSDAEVFLKDICNYLENQYSARRQNSTAD